jgi:GT2 family glycosyltransferase
VFELVGGYDERISSGEDFDIHRRYKKVTRVGSCDNVVYHNLGTLSLGRTLGKKYSYGKTANLYFIKHSESGASILREELRCYLRHYSAFFRHPMTGAASLFLKGAEFMSGGIGLAVSKLKGDRKISPAPRDT